MASRILVTGASGHLGALIVEKLIERGQAAAQIVAAARDPKKLDRLVALGAQSAQLDYDQPDTLTKAFEGIDTVILVSGSEVGQRSRQHGNVIDAAKSAGVTKLVYTSITNADTSHNPLAPEHKATEQKLQQSGVPFVIARDNWYTENYADAVEQARTSGVVTASAGSGKVASASRRDYADGIAAVALEDGHLSQVYEFGGDVAWGFDELAEAIGEVIGKPVSYQQLSTEEHVELLKSFGLDEGTASFVAGLDASIAAGELAFTDGTLARITGKPTTPLVAGLRAAAA